MKKSIQKYYLLVILSAAFLMPMFIAAQIPLNPDELTPPANLAGTVVDDNDVQLTWEAPNSGGDPLWLHWDSGTNDDSWGFMLNAANFDIAAKWDPSHITSYDGWEIVKIRFFITSSAPTLTIKVWEGSGPTETYSEAVSSFTEDDWTEITLDTPVTIDASTELWAGLNIDMPWGAACVGIDEGPAIDDYGNLYRYNGTWYSDFNNNNLQIYVAPAGAPRGTAELLGYNVYRDDAQINENTVPSTSYVDENLFNGTYEYYVTALYDDGESDPSNTIEITVDQPVILESDSLALVDLYNNCNGENWYNNENWLELMVSEWYGVITDGNRVSRLTLVFNDLDSDVPESFGDLTRLNYLNFSGNDLESLPSTFGNLESLNEFWMSQTLLTELPESFGDLDSLETLSLSDNEGVTSLPESFGDLEMLYWFGMGRCSLDGLPSTFGNLSNLYQCYIDDNFITELPEEFGDLPNVTYLLLDRNLLTALPESFGDLPSLKDLSASENMISILPESFGNISTLEDLTMHSNGMKSLPDNFGDLESLQSLRLSINDLVVLPASFSNLSSLHNCYLDQNLISELPEDFGNLSGLYDISLTHNELTELPESIGDLDSLLQMFVVSNKLMSLPETLGDMENIWVLGLGKNEIVELPESIGNLSTLGYIDLTENLIETLPSSMGDLNADTVLLSTNRITEIPESMFDNTYQYLWYDDNVLQFGSLEPFVGNVSIEYKYIPQDKFGQDTTIYPVDGGNVEFTWEVSGQYNVYKWYKEGVMLDGQNTNTLTIIDVRPEDEGVYTLQVTNTLITDLTLESHNVIIDAIVTGTEELELEDFTIYPNPLNGNSLQIANTRQSGRFKVQVISSTGQTMLEQSFLGQQAKLNMDDLPNGLYVVRITDESNRVQVTKLIKN